MHPDLAVGTAPSSTGPPKAAHPAGRRVTSSNPPAPRARAGSRETLTLQLPLTDDPSPESADGTAPRSTATVNSIPSHLEQVERAAERGVHEALTRVATDLADRSAEIRARLEAATDLAEAIVPLTRELLDRSLETSEWVASRHAEVRRELAATVDELVRQVESRMGAVTHAAEREASRIASAARDLERVGRRLGWRTWLSAGTSVAGTILVLTLLRPGWTMSAEQRSALRVGEAVISRYRAGSGREQAEMRQVMGWRPPTPADSAGALRSGRAGRPSRSGKVPPTEGRNGR
jgi:hypothetical protein